MARGLALKAALAAGARERVVCGDEELAERVEAQLEALEAEERGLDGRERELLRLLAEYEDVGRAAAGVFAGAGAGADAGAGVGAGEDVFRVLGGRYREVEEEIEAVRKDIETLETRVWRGR